MQNLAFLAYTILRLTLYIYSIYLQDPKFTSANDSLL